VEGVKKNQGKPITQRRKEGKKKSSYYRKKKKKRHSREKVLNRYERCVAYVPGGGFEERKHGAGGNNLGEDSFYKGQVFFSEAGVGAWGSSISGQKAKRSKGWDGRGPTKIGEKKDGRSRA